jgi:hypothetical protein
MQKTKGETKWLFNSIVKPTTKFLTISKSLRTFVVSISTIEADSILSMKRIFTTTAVMFGERLLIAIGITVEKIIKGSTNENMAS